MHIASQPDELNIGALFEALNRRGFTHHRLARLVGWHMHNNSANPPAHQRVSHRIDIYRRWLNKHLPVQPSPRPRLTTIASPPLTDIHAPDSQTDQQRWIERLAYLRDAERHIGVMHLHDVHAPFHDPAALGIAYDLLTHVQPHVTVVGSDTADFALLSSFDADPEIVENTDDELDQFERFWNGHIYEVRKRAPNTALVYVRGNHEGRIIRYLEKQAPKLRKRLMREFVRIIQCGGAVHFIGHVESVRLGPLLVMHGNRTNMHAAKSTLEDVAYQCTVQFGHIHRLNEYYKTGEDYQVGAVASGCLCEVEPHYMRGLRLRSKWQQGTAVMDVDLQSHHVHIDNLLFNRDKNEGRTWVRYERQLFEQPIVSASSLPIKEVS